MIDEALSTKPADLDTEFAKMKTGLVTAKIAGTIVPILILVLIVFWSQANIRCWADWTMTVKVILGLAIFVIYVAGKIFGIAEKDFYDKVEGQVPDLDIVKIWLRGKIYAQWFRIINLLLFVAIVYASFNIQTEFCAGSKKTRDEKVLFDVSRMQAALANYKDANGKYPSKEAVLTNGPIRDNNTIYLEAVPWPPIGMTLECMKFNEYFYMPAGADYEIKYCLDEAYKEIPRGPHTAGPKDLVWSETK